MDSENPAGLQPIQGESPTARQKRAKLVISLQQQVKNAAERTSHLEESWQNPDRTSADDADRGALAAGDVVDSMVEVVDTEKIKERIQKLRASTLEEVKCACGRTISAARLEALPETTQCIRCATKEESAQRNARLPVAEEYKPPRTNPRW